MKRPRTTERCAREIAGGALGEASLVATRLGAVEAAVTGGGPAVLCLHGAMGGADQAVLLGRTVGAPGFRYVCPSRPGYLGTPLGGATTPEAQADTYAALLDAIGVDDAAVLAVSGGGPSALQFALRHRNRCRALVLISTCAGVMDARIPLHFHLMMALVRWGWFADAMKRRAARDPAAAALRSIADPALRARVAGDRQALELLVALTTSTLDRIALRLVGTKNDIAVTRATTDYPLERIAVPTLVVHGTADPLLPFERHGRQLAGRIPGAELLALTGGEHGAIFTHREEARSGVAAFLRAHAARGDAAASPATSSPSSSFPAPTGSR